MLEPFQTQIEENEKFRQKTTFSEKQKINKKCDKNKGKRELHCAESGRELWEVMQKYEPLFMHVILFKFQYFSLPKKKISLTLYFPSTKLTTKQEKVSNFSAYIFIGEVLEREVGRVQAVNVYLGTNKNSVILCENVKQFLRKFFFIFLI